MADRFDLDAIAADDAFLDLLGAGGESARRAGAHDPVLMLLADLRLAVEVEDELPIERIDDAEGFLARCAGINPVTDPMARKLAARGLAFGVAAMAALSVSGVAAAVTGDPLSPYEKVIEEMVKAVRPEASFPKDQLNGMPVVDKTKIVKVAKNYREKQKQQQADRRITDTKDLLALPAADLDLKDDPRPPLARPTPPVATPGPLGTPAVKVPVGPGGKLTLPPKTGPTTAPTDVTPKPTPGPTTGPTPGGPTGTPDPSPSAPPATTPPATTTTPSTPPSTPPAGPDQTGQSSSPPTSVPAPPQGSSGDGQSGGVSTQPGASGGGTDSGSTTGSTTGPTTVPGGSSTTTPAEQAVPVSPVGGTTGDTSAEAANRAERRAEARKALARKAQARQMKALKAEARRAEARRAEARQAWARHSTGRFTIGHPNAKYAKGRHSNGRYAEGKHNSGRYAEGRHAALHRAHGSMEPDTVRRILGVINGVMVVR